MKRAFLSSAPEVRLVRRTENSFDLAVATARTCYSGKGIVTPEEVEQGAQGGASLGLQVGVALDHQPGVVASGLQELGVRREVSQAHVGQAALPCAQELAGAAQPQILLGDAEPVVGLAHDLEPRLGGGAERRLVEQQAGRALGAAPDAPA